MSYQYQTVEGLGEICLIKERTNKSKFRGYVTEKENFVVYGLSEDEVVHGLFEEYGFAID